MLNYTDLSPRQKQTVDRMVEYDPSLASATTISRQLVYKIFMELKETPKKIGFPVFLKKHNSISRGLYCWPNPNGIPLDIDISNETCYNQSSSAAIIKMEDPYLLREQEEFYHEAIEAGVTNIKP